MAKIDLKKDRRELYAPSSKGFQLVYVPRMQYLMIDGHGDPNTAEEYQAALETLYPVSYKLKFLSKAELEKDYVVMPLEGLWWADDLTSFVSREKDSWSWTMMNLQPEWITQAMLEQAIQELQSKRLPAVDELRLESYNEGLAVQIMHVGPYDDEGPVLRRLHEEYIPRNGLEMAGKHHEIYLSDPRRVAPEKLRTVLRQPVRKLSTDGAP